MNKTFDLRTKHSYAVKVYGMAVHSPLRVESSACVKSLEFADIRFILFVTLCDCKSAVPTPKLEASHIA